VQGGHVLYQVGRGGEELAELGGSLEGPVLVDVRGHLGGPPLHVGRRVLDEHALHEAAGPRAGVGGLPVDLPPDALHRGARQLDPAVARLALAGGIEVTLVQGQPREILDPGGT